MADPLTKSSALADELVKAVNTGILPEVDIHPPFRELLQHKAFLVEWMMDNIKEVATAVAFLGTDITDEIYKTFSVTHTVLKQNSGMSFRTSGLFQTLPH